MELIDLSNNKIDVISNDAFIDISNLQELYLDRNPIVLLDAKNLNLKTLKLTLDRRFQCSSMSLSSIQNLYLKDSTVDTFCGTQLPNLVVLHLDNVYVTSVNEKTLQGLRSVRSLQEQELFKNVKVLKRYTFKDVSSLSNLNLSGLSLEIIEPYAFDGLENLEKLQLDNNRLVELRKCSFCGLKHI